VPEDIDEQGLVDSDHGTTPPPALEIRPLAQLLPPMVRKKYGRLELPTILYT
jgi:hypothetical protein